MPKKSTVLAYVRCSTASQNEESQVMAIQEYCDNHNMEAVFYIDKATGKNLERDAMKKLQEDLFIGKSKTVVCYKLDRLSRQLVEGLNLLNDWLTSGVRVISITQQFDFSGSTGKLISAVLMAVSEMEMGLRQERVAIGIENAKKKGIYKGRLEGATKAKYKKAWDLYAKGLTMEEVGKSLGVSHRTATRYIDRTRAEWVMEDFRDAVWLVSKEKGVKPVVIIEKENQKNPKYPILKFAWGDASKLDDDDYTEVPRELVQLVVKCFTANYAESRLAARVRLIDLVRGLDSNDWVTLKSTEPTIGFGIPSLVELIDAERSAISEWVDKVAEDNSKKSKPTDRGEERVQLMKDMMYLIGEFKMPESFAWSEKDFANASEIALQRELNINAIHRWKKTESGADTDESILEAFQKRYDELDGVDILELARGESFELANLFTAKSIKENYELNDESHLPKEFFNN